MDSTLLSCGIAPFALLLHASCL